MDQFDRAQELDAQFRRQALQMRRRAAAVAGPALTHCLDCGDQIPEPRREKAPGCIRCTRCQELFEANERRR